MREAFARTGAAAVMLARGALGNPWLFAELLGERDERSRPAAEVLAELDWTIERAVEHLGEARAARYLRKFYPWYVARLGLDAGRARRLQESLQQRRHAGGRAGGCWSSRRRRSRWPPECLAAALCAPLYCCAR